MLVKVKLNLVAIRIQEYEDSLPEAEVIDDSQDLMPIDVFNTLCVGFHSRLTTN